MAHPPGCSADSRARREYWTTHSVWGYISVFIFSNNKLSGGRPPRCAFLRPPASWQYLRIYSPGGTDSGMLAYLRHHQQVDLLTLKCVQVSVTWATSAPILVFLGFSVLELGPMNATDRCQTDRRQTKASLNASALWDGGIIN